ncbi:MAG: alanyl-tRNA editing protein [Candidatus Woesearchaeota archaeon]|nr:MAG: alanyl-tRNA editing protein [Candidatus Woesearchaeota archaeon]
MDAYPLYAKDAYCKEFITTVTAVNKGTFIILADTIFYPQGGGQPHDEGQIEVLGPDGLGKDMYSVTFVGKFDGAISHEVNKEGLHVGDRVRCKLDWPRRYALMKMHTASHVLSQVFFQEQVLITGNQLDVALSRVDYSLDTFDREQMEALVAKANRYLQEDHKVEISFKPREDVLRMPGMVKLAGALPPNVSILRIVDITGVDVQADGGTHVHSTKECGLINIEELKNKGKNNRRLYFSLR